MRAPELSEIPVVLLAGGRSSRMPQPKGLVNFKGRPWLEWQLEQIAVCGMKNALVVLGHRADEYFSGISWLREASETEVTHAGVRVRSILNSLPEYGPFSSIQAAGRILMAQDIQSVFILPVDVPCPDPKVWSALALEKADAVLPEIYGRGGHPVRISRRFMERIVHLPPTDPESRLDAQIRRLEPTAVVRLPVTDPRIGTNLNTPEDWKAWEKTA